VANGFRRVANSAPPPGKSKDNAHHHGSRSVDDTVVTTPIPAGEPFDPAQCVVGLDRDTRDACFVTRTVPGPARIDGYTIGAPFVTHDPPHAGEMHPDGDELLFAVSGRFDVTLELDAGPRDLQLRAGDALVVPRGVWHLVTMQEPGQLVHVTPGPNGDHRPLTS
jgi:mannose-6-phosphate isomerase-like protein (cupin superfamily)